MLDYGTLGERMRREHIMTEHTPGPWKYHARLSASENHHGFAISAPTHKPSQHRIRIGDVIPMDADGAEGEANARLIAAAPRLLEALQIARNVVRHSAWCDQSITQEPVRCAPDCERGVIIAAIRAATGDDGE